MEAPRSSTQTTVHSLIHTLSKSSPNGGRSFTQPLRRGMRNQTDLQNAWFRLWRTPYARPSWTILTQILPSCVSVLHRSVTRSGRQWSCSWAGKARPICQLTCATNSPMLSRSVQHFVIARIYKSVTTTCEQAPSCRNCMLGNTFDSSNIPAANGHLPGSSRKLTNRGRMLETSDGSVLRRSRHHIAETPLPRAPATELQRQPKRVRFLDDVMPAPAQAQKKEETDSAVTVVHRRKLVN